MIQAVLKQSYLIEPLKYSTMNQTELQAKYTTRESAGKLAQVQNSQNCNQWEAWEKSRAPNRACFLFASDWSTTQTSQL